MKSLSDQYTSTHGESSDTFADLMFCALVVLVLFVLALAIEISQRVRAELVQTDPIEVVEAETVAAMTPEEIEALTKELQDRNHEIDTLKGKLQARVEQIEQQETQVANQMAAMSGEQRFTGARQPASLSIAYDYHEKEFFFVSSRKVDSADRRNSGEGAVEYITRKKTELAQIAVAAADQRGFSLSEAKALYSAFSTYEEVLPDGDSYKIKQSNMGVFYHVLLCAYIAGDNDSGELEEQLVTSALSSVWNQRSPKGDDMYPKVTLEVDAKRREIVVNGVTLSPRDLREILLSVDGRGCMLDLVGFTGSPPDWLREEVLVPAGYISGVPKLPGK